MITMSSVWRENISTQVVNMASSHRLFFAYESYMSNDLMKERCPDAERYTEQLGRIRHFEWYINCRGVASIRPYDDNATRIPIDFGSKIKQPELPWTEDDPMDTPSVLGILYMISREDEHTLDLLMGVPSGYQKHDMHVELVTSPPIIEGRAVAEDASSPYVQHVKAIVYVDMRKEGGICKSEYIGKLGDAFTDLEFVLNSYKAEGESKGKDMQLRKRADADLVFGIRRPIKMRDEGEDDEY